MRSPRNKERRGFARCIALTAVVAAATGYSPGAAPAEASMVAFAGVEPVRDLVQSIGGERVTARVLVPAGQSPHTFEPTPHQLAGLETAGLYFAVSMPFESAWVPRLAATGPGLRVVHLARGAAGDPHGHDALHPWTDPLAAVEIARRISSVLAEADPEGASSYGQRFADLSGKLESAHREMAGILEPYRGRAFVVYHPAWGALARRYGLEQLAVESGGKTPGARHLAELIAAARDAGACAVFAQPQFSDRAARRVAEALDVPVVSLDPLTGDLARHLPEVARTLARYLEQPCRP